MTPKWSVEMHKLMFTHVLLMGLPCIIYMCLRLRGWALVSPQTLVASLFLFNSVMIFAESTNAVFRRYAVRPRRPVRTYPERALSRIKSWTGLRGAERSAPTGPMPRCSFLVAAYLPNEQDIIIETLHHLLFQIERPAGGLEIILAYNTPVDLPVENDLRQLAAHSPELRLLRVDGSHSKAENLNAALNIVTGEISCVLDADHHPASDCFVRAWRWIEQGYDVIQGRNVIRNHTENFLTMNVALEFETLYGISHAAKSFLTDSSIFGGSNGYWRTSVLKAIRFNPMRLTEDIDASLRSLLNGYRILHDRSIITTELAPGTLKTFWYQRKRWAHGWLDVSLKYQRRVWRSPYFNVWQKFYWTYLLYYCESFAIFSLQLFPVLLSFLLIPPTVPVRGHLYLSIAGVLTFFSGIYQVLAAAKVASRPYPVWDYVRHILVLPIYVTLKNAIAIVAIYDYLQGNDAWIVTPRDTQVQKNIA